jgi:hypothetical protein
LLKTLTRTKKKTLPQTPEGEHNEEETGISNAAVTVPTAVADTDVESGRKETTTGGKKRTADDEDTRERKRHKKEKGVARTASTIPEVMTNTEPAPRKKSRETGGKKPRKDIVETDKLWANLLGRS